MIKCNNYVNRVIRDNELASFKEFTAHQKKLYNSVVYGPNPKFMAKLTPDERKEAIRKHKKALLILNKIKKEYISIVDSIFAFFDTECANSLKARLDTTRKAHTNYTHHRDLGVPDDLVLVALIEKEVLNAKDFKYDSRNDHRRRKTNVNYKAYKRRRNSSSKGNG